jgi:SAM-dependent methyltransferase
MADETESEQAKLWNGAAGRAWVDAQDLLDSVYKPVENLLVDALSEFRGPVLDVGCGTGVTTVAIARRLGSRGHAVGVDISEAMLAAARARTAREHVDARFILANAQVYPFEPASFNAIVSRFGVMFFDDPVAAFANLRRSATDGALLQFIAWRGPADNPFMTTAERAASRLLPNLPPRRPNAPGQFAFASDERVRAVLQESDWSDIDVRPIDVDCTLPERELVGYFTRLGPVGVALQDAEESTRAAVIEAVRPAFDPFVQGGHVRFTAACWMVRARTN